MASSTCFLPVTLALTSIADKSNSKEARGNWGLPLPRDEIFREYIIPPHRHFLPPRGGLPGRPGEPRWPGKFGRVDTWKIRLPAGGMARIRKDHDGTRTRDARPCFQGQRALTHGRRSEPASPRLSGRRAGMAKPDRSDAPTAENYGINRRRLPLSRTKCRCDEADRDVANASVRPPGKTQSTRMPAWRTGRPGWTGCRGFSEAAPRSTPETLPP